MTGSAKINKEVQRTTIGRALSINQDTSIYGAFAEIGAGQEVARFFFQAGQASQTIAKTISAYDMIYSDEIYGKEKNGRYVCESRLLKMLEKEYNLLERRLSQVRGDRTKFFAFADTVATGDSKKRFTHGWMGVRFQIKPGGPFNDIVMHVRLTDKFRLQQQETLGILGVNLVATAFQEIENVDKIVTSLVENIKEGQANIDFVRFAGPDVKHINNHLVNLELVRRGLADAVLFGPDESILNISDEFFKKSMIIQRGTFRPVTTTHVDVLEMGMKQFKKDFKEDPLVLFELTMHNLAADGNINEQDFLDRVRSLCALDRHVLVSNFHLFYRLKRFVRQYTQSPMVLIAGAYHLPNLFDEEQYKDLEGGLLEGLAKLLDEKTKLYIYPHKTKEICSTAGTFNPAAKLKKIYEHYRGLEQIEDIAGCDQIENYLHSHEVHKLLMKKDANWKDYVPEVVRNLIIKEKLFQNKI